MLWARWDSAHDLRIRSEPLLYRLSYETLWGQMGAGRGEWREEAEGGGGIMKVAIRGKLDVRGTSANVMLRHTAMILEVWK